MAWLLWVGLGVVASLVAGLLAFGLFLFVMYFYLRWTYARYLTRIFQETPLFIIPRGQPVPGAEDVTFPSEDGLALRGCYLKTAAPRRRGVILFGLEFGSNRWASVPYCESLLAHGFDVFAFESRGQGESEIQPGYEPLQWVADHEVRDARAALRYLKDRPDADPRGVGFFGVSKGGGAGLIAAAADPYVRCFVTDGIFGTFTTMVPYMKKWITIYSKQYLIQALLPDWYYELIARTCVGRLQKIRNCRYVDLEKALPRLAPRPLLMIHGGADTYIKPEMARALFRRARRPKDLWLVDGAKHNQAIQVAGAEYHRRVCEFFQTHLAEPDDEEGPAPRRAEARQQVVV